jgi:hypothetical protein
LTSIIVALACGGGAAPTTKPVSESPPAPAAAPAAAPAWEVPEGWRTETIPFPLDFAKTLPYRGVEELRFPKAFLTAGDDWYFSYAFIWHVAAPWPADADALEADLVAYFRGLSIAVGGEERADIAAHPFSAQLDGDLAKGRVTGTVAAFDPFATQAPVALHVRIWAVPCTAAHERAYVFLASPRAAADGDAVWVELERLGGAFRCP